MSNKSQPFTISNRLVLLGATVGASAIMVAGCSGSKEVETASIEPVPAVTAPAVTAPAPVPEAVAKPKPMPAAPAKPGATPIEVAIAHTDGGVNYAERAQTLLEDGKLRAALVALRKDAHTNPPTADTLLTIGRLARQTKKYKLAQVALERGMVAAPDRSDLPVELARTLLSAGRPRAAQKAARKALRADRTDGSAWNQLGRAEMKRSRWDVAEIAFKKAVHLEPLDGMFHNNLGLLYVYMKKGPKAVEVLERAVELLEDDTPHYVLNNLGLAHELAGQPEEAREAFEEALLVNPFYTKAKVNLERVEATIAASEDDRAFKTAKGVEVESPTPEDS